MSRITVSHISFSNKWWTYRINALIVFDTEKSEDVKRFEVVGGRRSKWLTQEL